MWETNWHSRTEHQKATRTVALPETFEPMPELVGIIWWYTLQCEMELSVFRLLNHTIKVTMLQQQVDLTCHFNMCSGCLWQQPRENGAYIVTCIFELVVLNVEVSISREKLVSIRSNVTAIGPRPLHWCNTFQIHISCTHQEATRAGLLNGILWSESRIWRKHATIPVLHELSI